MAAIPVSPLLLERYELKYLIPLSLVEPISNYVSQICYMDYYSEMSPDGYYLINSLYFDTPSFLFIKKRENNCLDRFSMRVRSYGDTPKPPYYFETKEKVFEFTKKIRGPIHIENFGELFVNTDLLMSLGYDKDPHITNFIRLANTHNAAPVILTQYKRRAYISRVDAYARVTFDRHLKYQQESNYNVNPTPALMSNYDYSEAFGHPYDNVILEIKCERKIPVWIIDLIQRFNLTRRQFSKFDRAVRECFDPSCQFHTVNKVAAY